MKYPKVAITLLFVAIGCFILAVFGESIRAVFLAVGISCLLLAYAANQRTLKRLEIDPFTSQQTDTVDRSLDNDEPS
jgi:small neutral amino acid transporter SnatA (MarC family)